MGKIFKVPMQKKRHLKTELSLDFPSNFSHPIKKVDQLPTTDFISNISQQIDSMTDDMNHLYKETQKESTIIEPELSFMEKVAISIISILIGLHILKAIMKCVENQILKIMNRE